FDGSHPRPLDRNLLPHHDAVTTLVAPTAGRAIRLPLTALAYSLLDLSVHQQPHQLHPGLPDQLTDALMQPAQHLGHREHHLYGGIAVGGHCLKLFHRLLRINLVWFLHVATLLFFGNKFPSGYHASGKRESLLSTDFYELPGNPSSGAMRRQRDSTGLPPNSTRMTTEALYSIAVFDVHRSWPVLMNERSRLRLSLEQPMIGLASCPEIRAKTLPDVDVWLYRNRAELQCGDKAAYQRDRASEKRWRNRACVTWHTDKQSVSPINWIRAPPPSPPLPGDTCQW